MPSVNRRLGRAHRVVRAALRALPSSTRPVVRWVRRRSWALLALVLAPVSAVQLVSYFSLPREPGSLRWVVPATLFAATAVAVGVATGQTPAGRPAWASMLHLAESLHRYRQDPCEVTHQQVSWVLSYLSAHSQRQLLRHLDGQGVQVRADDLPAVWDRYVDELLEAALAAPEVPSRSRWARRGSRRR